MVRRTESLIQSHIELIYDSVGSPEGWQALIETLVSDLNCRSGHISLEALNQSGIKKRYSSGISQEENDLVINYFHAHDNWTKALVELPERKFYASEHLVSPSSTKGSIFYEEYCKKFDLGYLTGAIIESDNDSGIRMALHHSEKQGPLNEKIDYLNLLTPHFRRAAKLHQKLDFLNNNNANFTKLLDKFPVASLLVDNQHKVRYLNTKADEILTISRLLSIDNNQLTVKGPQQLPLNQSITLAIQNSQGRAAANFFETLIIRDRNGTPEAELQIEPYSTYSQEFGFQYRKAFALVFINILKMENRLNSRIITKLYKLTKKETLLAELLAEGNTLEEISIKTHRSTNTIKTQLKSLFKKTETNTQQQLIAKLLSNIASFR